MNLTLTINGEKKNFYSRGLTAGASFLAYDMLEEMGDRAKSNTLYDKEHREELLRFVVDFFGKQFTEQEFLEGCEDSFFNIVPTMLRSVVAGVSAKVQSFPNVPAGSPEKA